jgi:hypothetical protein
MNRQQRRAVARRREQLTDQLLRAIGDFVRADPDADDPNVFLIAVLDTLRICLAQETCPSCREQQRQVLSEGFALAMDDAMKHAGDGARRQPSALKLTTPADALEAGGATTGPCRASKQRPSSPVGRLLICGRRGKPLRRRKGFFGEGGGGRLSVTQMIRAYSERTQSRRRSACGGHYVRNAKQRSKTRGLRPFNS